MMTRALLPLWTGALLSAACAVEPSSAPQIGGRRLCATAAVAPAASLDEPQVSGPCTTERRSTLAVGWAVACAVRSGELWCWGNDTFGWPSRDQDCASVQVYPAPRTPQVYPPTRIYLEEETCAVAAGFGVCVIGATGRVRCLPWAHVHGMHGLMENLQHGPPPTPWYADGVVALDVAGDHSRFCARTADGGVWCWGIQRTQSDWINFKGSPRPVPQGSHRLRDVARVTVDAALDRDGRLHTWRAGADTWHAPAPCWSDDVVPTSAVHIPTVRPVSRVERSGGQLCTLDEVGTIACWGAHEPCPHVASARELRLPRAREIACGYSRCCAVTRDDDLYCWGSIDVPFLPPEPWCLDSEVPTPVLRAPIDRVAVGRMLCFELRGEGRPVYCVSDDPARYGLRGRPYEPIRVPLPPP